MTIFGEFCIVMVTFRFQDANYHHSGGNNVVDHNVQCEGPTSGPQVCPSALHDFPKHNKLMKNKDYLTIICIGHRHW